MLPQEFSFNETTSSPIFGNASIISLERNQSVVTPCLNETLKDAVTVDHESGSLKTENVTVADAKNSSKSAVDEGKSDKTKLANSTVITKEEKLNATEAKNVTLENQNPAKSLEEEPKPKFPKAQALNDTKDTTQKLHKAIVEQQSSSENFVVSKRDKPADSNSTQDLGSTTKPLGQVEEVIDSRLNATSEEKPALIKAMETRLDSLSNATINAKNETTVEPNSNLNSTIQAGNSSDFLNTTDRAISTLAPNATLPASSTLAPSGGESNVSLSTESPLGGNSTTVKPERKEKVLLPVSEGIK